MTTKLSFWTRSHSLVLYFLLAYAISWAIEIPIALSLRSIINLKVPLAIHYLASFGPFLAALVVTIGTEGYPGVRRLFSGLAKWRVGRGYVLFAVLAPPFLFAVAVLFSRIAQGAWPDLRLLGQADYLPYLGVLPVLILWLLTFGFGEEMGWRGFALPRLQANRSAYSASLILGLLWALWHVPAFFYRDTYVAMGLLLPLMLISVLAASVVHTWLYNGSGGSLLMVILFHGLFDFFSVSSAGGDGAAIVMSAAIVFWAIRVLKVYGPANLAPVEKVTADGPLSRPATDVDAFESSLTPQS
ncbi:MAG TPA: CPBP family intramembrane glutamic endopeptidase [Anaerolineae bacterium]